jgi:predicted enzyme related to lactoylglutathione lyase
MSLKIKELAFVLHKVSDIARARDFYGNTLGLKLGIDKEFAPGLFWLEYDIGGTALGVSNSEAPKGTSNASIAIEVEDIDAALAALKASGATVEFEIFEFPVCKLFGITSPDGHSIMFHQKKA